MLNKEAAIKPHDLDLREIENKIDVIARKYRPEKIMLFGSCAKGQSSAASDADLLVIMNTERSTWDLAVEISLAVKHSFPMDILVRTPQEIADRLALGDFFMQSIMEHGKVLYERVG